MGIRDEDHWLSLVDGFTEAAVRGAACPEGWFAALGALADATGSSRGELIGIGDRAAFQFNLMQDFPDDARAEFFEIGAYSPAINPRVAAGMGAGVLETLAEAAYEQVRPQLRSEVFLDWAERHDIPFGCQTNLVHEPDRLIGMAMLRSRRDGPSSEEDRRAFAAVSPHVRAAVRMQLALEDQGVALLAGALGALSIAAFVCERDGKVQACSAAAEAMIGGGGLIDVRQGRLTAQGASNEQALLAAVRRAGLGWRPDLAPPNCAVALRPETPAQPPLVLDVFALPRLPRLFAGGPCVLVAARGGRDGSGAAEILQHAYGLTPAEAAVAVEMARGRSREMVARDRGVSVGTVRIQLKGLFLKLGVRREAELAALLSPLI